MRELQRVDPIDTLNFIMLYISLFIDLSYKNKLNYEGVV